MLKLTELLTVGILLLPLIGAVGVTAVGRKSEKGRELMLRLVTLAELALCAALFAAALKQPDGTQLRADGFCALGLRFRADGFRALYALIASWMWALSCQFSRQYFSGHGRCMGRYACATLLTLCGTAGVFLSDDLYTAFVFFEIMSIASYPWVAHEETGEALRAAGTYLFVSVICSMVTLMGMFLLWRETGDLTFESLRARNGDPALALPACLTMVGYCAKAGMVPLHIWLPKAHPAAPAPASALLSGVLTKTGLFGVIAVSMNLLNGSRAFGHALLAVGLVTMTLGAVLAVYSVNLKRTLACSSLSQIGYITVGVACAVLPGGQGPQAAAGAVGHMINHSLLKLCLFLCAGAIYMNAHTLDLNRLRGFGRGKRLLHAAFLLGALGLMGVPLLNGYPSKTMIHEALAELAAEGPFAYRACEWIFLFAAGLTTAYMLKIYICLFWQKNDDPEIQAAYDRMNGRSLTPRSALVLLLTAAPLAVLGAAPNRTLLPLTRLSAGFFGKEPLAHSVAFFSPGNLTGGGISLLIGIIVYLLFVRKALYDGKYLEKWPRGLDLEEKCYRPLFCRILPNGLYAAARLLNGLPEWMEEKLPGVLTAAFRWLDALPGRIGSGLIKAFKRKERSAGK